MYKRLLLLSALLACFVCLANAQPTVEDYRDCLEKLGEDPVEYIFRQFETCDVVILGERDHRDITQYGFILRLLADKRFAERIGYVYTEVGVTNMTESANRLIKTDWTSEEEFRKELGNHLRNEDYLFLWEKTNRSVFIDSLYHINRRLPTGKRITLGLTDIAFDWSEWTSPVKYRKWVYKNTYYHEGQKTSVRDREMARNFLSLYKKQRPTDRSRKALVIWNQPHAVCLPNCKGAGYRVKKALGGGRVKIVCLNYYESFAPGAYGFAAPHGVNLIDDGRWDAAFALTGDKPVGFDIKDTPFGKTESWYWDDGTMWEDIADGYIFYVPFHKFNGACGIKDILNEECRTEMQRRLNLMYSAGEIPTNDWNAICQYYNNVRTFPIPEEKKRERLMEQLNSLIKK